MIIIVKTCIVIKIKKIFKIFNLETSMINIFVFEKNRNDK